MPRWTPEQSTAINRTGCDMLVSASAGTGKTAVLVERVVRLLLDVPEPVDLDRFLVVTFTEAAAAEMRERVGSALRARLFEKPEDTRLRRQVALIEKARISTIHAFCSALLHEHFYVLGLDPWFQVLDEDEGRLLRAETVAEVFRDAFEKRSEVFSEWLDTFVGSDPEVMAHGAVLDLCRFLESLDDPGGWARFVRESYPVENGHGMEQPFEQHAWFAAWGDEFHRTVEELRNEAVVLIGLGKRCFEKYAEYVGAAAQPLFEAAEAIENDDWKTAVDAFQDAAFPERIPSLSKNNKTEEAEALKARVLSWRDRYKGRLLGDLAAMSAAQMCMAHACTAPQIHLMLDLAEAFGQRYMGVKRRRAQLDFGDLERLALQLLRDPENPAEPSATARLCRDRFEFVLVDEYQDINPVQDAILRLVSREEDPERAGNLFAVGDVKQSIYAFRLAAPELFLQRYDTFPPAAENPPEDTPNLRVDLTRNFRSRSGVLHAVNWFFERLMRRESSGLDYDEAAHLVPGAEFPPAEEGRPDPQPIEVHLIDEAAPGTTGEDSDEDAAAGEDLAGAEAEATLVARRLLEMVRPDDKSCATHVFDRATESLRPATWSDCAVLVRSMTHADTYMQVFRQLGVPAFADLGSGFFQAMEVRDILNLLRVIDNPLQDIPLAALLRSPIVDWSDDDLARIRLCVDRGLFYDALCAAGERDDALGERVRGFLERLEAWRTRARRARLADLIGRLYEETRYPIHVIAGKQGQAGVANLRRLHDLTREFDTFTRQGLARFLHFIEELQREEGDLGVAATIGEGEDVVRLITVHKSKGLEFPIVCLPELGKRFNITDLSERVLTGRQEGIGMTVVDREAGVRYPSPAHRLLRIKRKREQWCEEMRVFYVALTRARERLLLFARAGKIEKQLGAWLAVNPGEPLDADVVLGASGYLGWLGPLLACDSEARKTLEDPKRDRMHELKTSAPFALTLHTPAGISVWRDACTVTPESIEETAPRRVETEEVEALLARLDWQYPHRASTVLPARITVSEVKRRLAAFDEEGERSGHIAAARQRTFDLPQVEAKPQSGEPSGADRGTWTHLVLQHLDLFGGIDRDEVSRQVDRMIDRGLLTEEQREALDLDAIAAFFASDLGRRMLAQPEGRVWREVPFVLAVSAQEVGLAAPGEAEGETVRLQGVIDCVFQEDEGMVLVDYKTDRVPRERLDERAAFYKPQMDWYGRAVAEIFGDKTKEKNLYFLELCEARTV